MAESNPTIKQYPLERRKIVKKYIASMFGWGILFLIAIIVSYLAAPSIVIVEVALFVLLALFYVWYEIEYFNKYYYDIRTDFLVIKKGVFAPRETTLPYEKLQDVYIDQDIFDRIFGLWDTHVSTVTPRSEMHGHIDGLNQENGRKIADMLLERIKTG